ncbi:MAG: cupin domain-containing protein, partial [Deltaproteobacteria bacterium]|nr:cupin domain-containing protein [Deltaproteobacteria bacterium]
CSMPKEGGLHMTEPRTKVCHYSEVKAEVFGDEAPGVTIRWVIDEEKDGAPTYALRVIEVAPGGNTPNHTHSFEHENYIMEGKGRVQIDGEWFEVAVGDIVFVPPNSQHTYVNTGNEVFKFLCGIPVSKLRSQD